MDLKYYKDKKSKGRRDRERGETVFYSIRKQCKGSSLSGLVLPGCRGTTVKQTENKREHRQTFTHAHWDFFCMTGGTCRELQRGQRADGVIEVGG